MITHLMIENFLSVDKLSLNFEDKMTVFTGETGVGKSVLLRALSILLGETLDKNSIQSNKTFCRLIGHFSLTHSAPLKQWIIENGYYSQNEVQCCITRVTPKKGYTLSTLNGKKIQVKQLKVLHHFLMSVHKQHAQQRLMKKEYQRYYLDHYGQYIHLSRKVEQLYTHYKNLRKAHQELCDKLETQKEHLPLLNYQRDELYQIQFQENELIRLEQEQHRLAHTQKILEYGTAVTALMDTSEPESFLGLFQQVTQYLKKIVSFDKNFLPLFERIERIREDLKEINETFYLLLEKIQIDPEQLNKVEKRLSTLHSVARKHGVSIEQLPTILQQVEALHNSYEKIQQTLQCHEKKITTCLSEYQSTAGKLTKKREDCAIQLEEAVTKEMQNLGMVGGSFKVSLVANSDHEPTAFGLESVEFFLKASSGQTFELLSRTASGGELSRLNLILHSLVAQMATVPTLIFDEVDIGVGGSTAERIGRLIYQLSQTHQILCITHSPQIAALGQHHYQILKMTQENRTNMIVNALTSIDERVQEIARMLGGIEITEQTIAHAQTMLHAV